MVLIITVMSFVCNTKGYSNTPVKPAITYYFAKSHAGKKTPLSYVCYLT